MERTPLKSMGADVAALAAANPLIGRTEIIKDYAGIERVVVAWRQAE